MSTSHAKISISMISRVLLALGVVAFFSVFSCIGLDKMSAFSFRSLQPAFAAQSAADQPPLLSPDAPKGEPAQQPSSPDLPVTPKAIPAVLPETLPETLTDTEAPQAESLQKERELVPAEQLTILPPPPAPAPVAEPAPEQPSSSDAQAMPEPSPEQPIGQAKAEGQAPPAKVEPFSWPPLIARLAADGFDPAEMEQLFASLSSPPLPEFMAQKAVELYGRYGKASLDISDENRVKFAPPDYTRIAGGMTAAAGRRLMQSSRPFFESLYKQFGVPAPFVVAIMMVETGLGAELGKQSALLALGSMAVADDLAFVLPVIKGLDSNHDAIQELIKARSDWAYAELKALIEYAKAVGKDAGTIPGSVYGAIGICQFMPSNIPLYGVSTNKKRPVPDLFVLSDAAASVARYLAAHGWRKAQTPAAQLAVLRSYNHSDVYASTVYGVATALMSPTTHRGAAAAREGRNAVQAARATAREALPPGAKKAEPIKQLPGYKDLLK